jgi:hypothetical protein
MTGYVKNAGVSAAIPRSPGETSAEIWHDFVPGPKIGNIIDGGPDARRGGRLGLHP